MTEKKAPSRKLGHPARLDAAGGRRRHQEGQRDPLAQDAARADPRCPRGRPMIMGNFDTTWISMKRFLGNTPVKDDIINFDSRDHARDPRGRAGPAQQARQLLRARSDPPRLGRGPSARRVGQGEPRVLGRAHRIKPLQDENDRLQADLADSRTASTSASTRSAPRRQGAGAEERLRQATAEAETLKASLPRPRRSWRCSTSCRPACALGHVMAT